MVLRSEEIADFQKKIFLCNRYFFLFDTHMLFPDLFELIHGRHKNEVHDGRNNKEINDGCED